MARPGAGTRHPNAVVFDRAAAVCFFEHADHDPTRPLIEFYRREGEVDCLVPVNAAVVSPANPSGIEKTE